MQLAIKIILQAHFGTVETEYVERLSSQYDCVIDDLDDALNGAWNFGDGSKVFHVSNKLDQNEFLCLLHKFIRR